MKENSRYFFLLSISHVNIERGKERFFFCEKNHFKFVWGGFNFWKKKVVLVDGNNIAYRAFFALPLLNNDKGIHTNAIYGFTMMLMRILEEEKPTHMLVAFDAGKTTFRHKTYSEYKGGRQKDST